MLETLKDKDCEKENPTNWYIRSIQKLMSNLKAREEEIEKELGTQLEKSKGDMKAIMRAGQNYAEKMYSLRMMYEKENKRLIKEWDRKVEEQDSCR